MESPDQPQDFGFIGFSFFAWRVPIIKIQQSQLIETASQSDKLQNYITLFPRKSDATTLESRQARGTNPQPTPEQRDPTTKDNAAVEALHTPCPTPFDCVPAMRRFHATPSTNIPETIRRPFIQNFDGNFEDMSSVGSPVPEISTLGLGEISFPASAAKGSFALPALAPASTVSRSDPLTSGRSYGSSRHQQRAAIRSNPALRMPLAKRLAKSQLQRLSKDPNGSAMAGMKAMSDKEEAEALSLRAAKVKQIKELRAELREEATERWVYKRAPSTLSKSMSMPGTVFAKPPAPKNMGAKPRPGASFTVDQKRKLRKWFDQLDAVSRH